MKRWICLIVVVLYVACGEERSARVALRDGLVALKNGDAGAAREKFLAARADAGVDPDLRYRAALALGLAAAADAEKKQQAEPPELDQALTAYKEAAMWFGDAKRLREAASTDSTNANDADTNLAIVNQKALALADEISRGQNGLEPRLAAVIEQQRKVLDQARAQWDAQSRGDDTWSHSDSRTALALAELAVSAEAGVISDLAAASIDPIAKKPEGERTMEEAGQLIALQQVDASISDARGLMGGARRQFQEGQLEAALDTAHRALLQLKRAQEHLAEPVQVLGAIAGDQRTTQQLSQYVVDAAKQKLPVPAWLTTRALANDQTDVRERLTDLIARLSAWVNAPAQPTDSEPADPSERRMKERLRDGLPALGRAASQMERAQNALTDTNVAAASSAGGAAAEEIEAALELFLDAKQTIDLIWRSHEAAMASLAASTADGAPSPELMQPNHLRRSSDQNVARLDRLARLLAEAKEDALAQRDQPAQPADPAANAGPTNDASAQIARLDQAEALRGYAKTSAAAFAAALAKQSDAMTPGKQTREHVRELRKLFFTIVEHLKELIAEQSETKDATGKAHALDDADRRPLLPPLVQRQAGHTRMAGEIGKALAEMADKAAASPEQNQPPYAAAAEEVRLALGQLDSVDVLLGQAADPAAAQSIDLAPGLDAQTKALEHLTRALELLEPPKQDQKQDQQQQSGGGNDNKQKPQPAPPQSGTAQRVRDREAERKQAAQPAGGRDVVEKDW